MFLLLFSIFSHFDFNIVIELIILITLFLCSGFISASEVAFFSIKPVDLNHIENNIDYKSKIIIKKLKQPEKLLATILISNNFVNIAIVLLSTYIINSFLSYTEYQWLVFLLEVVLVTILILIIGEIIPKIFALENNLKVSYFMVYPIHILELFFYPLISLMLKTTNIVQKKLTKIKPAITVDDLSDVIKLTSSSLKDEKPIFEGIIRFGNTEVNQIMKPRVDIVAVSIDLNFYQLLNQVVESGYSRIPVYKDNFDKIEGIILTKDLLPYIDERADFNWQSLIKPAYYVPESKKIDDLLSEFQKNKIHLAIVVDEHGGTCGLVTMEDILEEIVGEIEDESDEMEEALYKTLTPNSWIFEGKIPINDFFKITKLDYTFFTDFETMEFETLAGLILELKGEIPHKGEKLKYKNISFEIEAADNRRIKQVKVSINN